MRTELERRTMGDRRSNSQHRHIHEPLASGDLCYTKPFSTRQLVDTINKAIQQP
jgi:hypothetical protein